MAKHLFDPNYSIKYLGQSSILDSRMTAKQARPFARLALAIVVGALIIGALVYAAIGSANTVTVTSAVTSQVTETSTFSTTLSTAVTVTETLNHTTTVSVYSAGSLVGTCATNNYVVPVQSSSVVTTISDGLTRSYTTTYPLTTTDYGGSSYTTTIDANTTGTFTIFSTTTEDYSPSAGWTVTVCTFSG
jgi:hypothetical protein